MEREKAIGVFDSGIGGLSVLKSLIKLLPTEDTIYLGDTARVPYGTKSAETVTRYSIENADFLSSKGIKLLVVACNTASAFALEVLRKKYAMPVIGVIKPGARKAAEATRTGTIGVIGTEGTVRSGAYESAIRSLNPDIRIKSRACPLLVPLAEEGWTDNEVARKAVEIYLRDMTDIDTLVLGCTHYPLLKDTISSVVGAGIRLIDSGEETACDVKEVLASSGLMNESGKGIRRFFVTDDPERFMKVGRNFLGSDLACVEKIG